MTAPERRRALAAAWARLVLAESRLDPGVVVGHGVAQACRAAGLEDVYAGRRRLADHLAKAEHKRMVTAVAQMMHCGRYEAQRIAAESEAGVRARHEARRRELMAQAVREVDHGE